MFQHFEEYVSCIFMVLMSICITLQVVCRYGISYSLDWAEELGRYLFIAMIYFGLGFAEQHDRHLSVTILCTSGGRWCAKWLPRISRLISTAFCLLMTVWGTKMVFFVYETDQVAPALQFPMWIVYATVPVGMFCMAVRALQNLFTALKNDTAM